MWRLHIDALKRYYHCNNGTTGNDDAGNVLANNVMELIPLTEVRYHRSCDINYTPATAINGGNVPTINPQEL
jgi:hypothetical protein